MKLKVNLSPLKARNFIPDVIAFKAIVYGFEKPLAELSDRIEYFVIVLLLYVVLSLLSNTIAYIIEVIKSGYNKITEKSIDVNE